MKDQYGWAICYNDVRRRPDIKNNTKHDVWRLSGVTLQGHEDKRHPNLCINCKSWVDDEGEFIQTI